MVVQAFVYKNVLLDWLYRNLVKYLIGDFFPWWKRLKPREFPSFVSVQRQALIGGRVGKYKPNIKWNLGFTGKEKA